MEKEFVSYDIALAMKELGFDEPCLGVYLEFGGLTLSSLLSQVELKNNKNCLAPLYQQTFKWFRGKYEIFVNIHTIHYGWNQNVLHTFSIRKIESKKIDTFLVYRTDTYISYEEAELACLRKLIEIVNQNKYE